MGTRGTARRHLPRSVACIMLAFVCGCSPGKGTVTITNRSSFAVLNGSITVCRVTHRIERLPPNASQTLAFDVKCDSGYDLVVNFENGVTLRDPVGYVTSGLRFTDEIEVTLERASLRRVEAKPL